jgi:hypothetical protein
MAKTDITRQKIKSKIEAIKKINDDPKSLTDDIYDAFKDKLSSTDGVVQKRITDFTSKIKGETENKKDIFGEILDITEGFLGVDKEDPINPKTKPLVKTKVLKYSKESTKRTIRSTPQIISDECKKALFGGVGICDINTPVGISAINLPPRSFDFLNMLKLNPDSISGQLMYEDSTIGVDGNVKFNKVLYEQFDTTNPYVFKSKDNSGLFTLEWNVGTQEYNISGLPSTMKMGEFFDNYYNAIEYPDAEHIFKTAMLMTLQGDNTEPSSFKEGMKLLNRLSTKLLSVCGNPVNDQPLLNNTPQQLTEDETDIQDYFDFDDVEGIDLDEEDARLRRVLKFTDCNNFEVQVSTNHMEDFTYLQGKKNFDENIINTLNKAANDAYEQSDASIPFDLFQLSLTSSYILKIPRALVSSVLSPKMIFPIALIYKDLKNTSIDSEGLMKKLYNLFFNIIKAIYWKFIKEFWGFVKRDLLQFLKETASAILSDKLKKMKDIVATLIGFLTDILKQGKDIQCCTEIFNAILKTIELAINKDVSIPIPGLLLLMSKKLPGFSSNRAYLDAMERLEAAGINTGPLYGTDNKLTSLVKGMTDSIAKELGNAKVRAVIEGGVIPAGVGQAVIPPGLILVTGILE